MVRYDRGLKAKGNDHFITTIDVSNTVNLISSHTIHISNVNMLRNCESRCYWF